MIHGDNQYSSKYLKQMFKIILETNYAAITGSRMKNKNNAIKVP